MDNRKGIMVKLKRKVVKNFFRFLRNDPKINKVYDDRDFSSFEKDVINKTSLFTMTSSERIVSLIRATEYVVKNNIHGSIVECGVWKGGSIMAALYTLKNLNSFKEVYLYDTFEGMTEPTDMDLSHSGSSAKEIYKDKEGSWCYSSLGEVKSNIEKIKYPEDKIHFIKGKVEDTIPYKDVPQNISLLRLDTDWYESTLHEMNHLFPRLVKGGIIIIDD